MRAWGAALGLFGKILGGMAGFAIGGPAGAMLGMGLGHAADEGTLGKFGPRGLPGPADLAALLGNRESLFAVAVVVLSAKLAKADGPVQRVEIDAFKRCFRIPPESMPEVARLYDDAKRSAEGYEPFAERLGEAFADNKAMLGDVLAALFSIARADGPITKGELNFLSVVHEKLGLDRGTWDRARDGLPHNPSASTAASDGAADAYMTLGVTRGASDDELRQTWRKLMRENHPDSLAARGVPQEFVKRATDKVAEINAAWDRIKKERGL